MPEITKSKLEKFIKIRNKSPHQSNLQFGFDAREAGFSTDELGDAVKREEGGYVWNTKYGDLIEMPNGQMELQEAG